MRSAVVVTISPIYSIVIYSSAISVLKVGKLTGLSQLELNEFEPILEMEISSSQIS